MKEMRIGQILVEKKYVTYKQIDQGLAEQRRRGGRLGSILVKLGFITEEQLVEALSEKYGVEGVVLSDIEIDKNVLEILLPRVATQHMVVPIKREGRTLVVAMADPSNVYAIDDVRVTTGLDIKPVVAAEFAVREAVEKYYGERDELERVMEEVEEMASDEDVEVMQEAEEEEAVSDLTAHATSGPVVQLVNKILMKAIEERCSDLHIEPYEHFLRVRYRIDGVLYEKMRPPLKWHKAIVSRLKLMAGLRIAEKRRPQDGRFRVKFKGKKIDFRMATVPTLFGEKVAIRILDRSAVSFNIDDLGFEPEAAELFRKGINYPYGIVLVTGPTGSGKTTTLYAACLLYTSPSPRD